MTIRLGNFSDFFTPGDTEFEELIVQINYHVELVIESCTLSENKDEIKIGTITHNEYEGVCPFCKKDVDQELECSFAMNDEEFQKKLINTIHEYVLEYTPLVHEKGKVISVTMYQPEIRNHLFLGKEHDMYWYSNGEVIVSFNQKLFTFDIVASFDNGQSLILDDHMFSDINEDNICIGKKGPWRVYFNQENIDFDDIPRISLSASRQLMHDTFSQITPFLDTFEKEIKEKETSYPIPIINDVVVKNGEEDADEFHFTFSIEGLPGRFEYTLEFEYSPGSGFLWEGTYITQDGMFFETFPASYRNHIYEQCITIIRKYDKVWRIRMITEPHEHNFIFPLFQPADYQMDKKRIDFRYENIIWE